MTDFHVVAIHYKALSGAFVQYDAPAPLTGRSADFSYELADGHLTLTPIQHFATEVGVVPLAEAFVRAWEIASGLEMRHPQILFTFERIEIEDRDPPVPGSVNVAVAHGILAFTAAGTLSVTRGEYPPPPSVDFEFTPEVATLWSRYQQYVSMREPILSMANFVLTYIESLHGGTVSKRRTAAAALNIDYSVLSKLGEIAGKYGDDLEARKRVGPAQQLTAQQADWVDAAVRGLIRSLAQSSTARAARPLTLADLPHL